MITDEFIRDLREAIGDVLDKHENVFIHLKGGLEFWDAITEGAVLAAQRHLTQKST